MLPTPIRAMLIFLAYMSLMGMSYNTLYPALAARAAGGAKTLGAITAAAGFGALSGAIYLARRRSITGLGRLAGRAAITFSLGLIAIGWTRPFALLLGCVFATGLSMMTLLAAGNTVIQTLVEDDKRGRVMAFFTFALMGTGPFGSLLMGWLAQRLGISWTFTLCGGACLLGALAYVNNAVDANPHSPTCGRAINA